MIPASILLLILKALKYLIFADVLLSWIMPDADRFPRSFTRQITDPLYAPIRAILRPERMGGLDVSPLLILILLQVMEGMLRRVL